jgi:hypothetical protein
MSRTHACLNDPVSLKLSTNVIFMTDLLGILINSEAKNDTSGPFNLTKATRFC